MCRGAVAALFNLGAAQEASVVMQAVYEGCSGGAGSRGRRQRSASVAPAEAQQPSNRDAISCFTQALSYDAAHQGAHVALAALLLRRHKPREALSHLNHQSRLCLLQAHSAAEDSDGQHADAASCTSCLRVQDVLDSISVDVSWGWCAAHPAARCRLSRD